MGYFNAEQVYWSHLKFPTAKSDVRQYYEPLVQPQAVVQQPNCAFKYAVQPGDSIYLIAQRFNINIDALLNANPQVTNPDQIFPGLVLCIPDQELGGMPPADCSGFIYTVMQGDTLWLISQRFGVSLQAIINANPQVTNPNRIFPGQRICIPAT